jgi:hypothetical protein
MDAEVYGRVCSRHPVSHRAWGRLLAGPVALGGAASVAEVVLALTRPDMLLPGSGWIGPGGAGGPLTAVWMLTLGPAAVLMAAMLRWLPRGYLDVRERGLVWGTAWRARGRRWEDVRALDVRRGTVFTAPSPTPTGLYYRCTVVFADGSRVTFRDNTAGYAALEKQLWQRCPAAVALPPEQRRWRRWRWAWPAGALLLLAADAAAWRYVSSAPAEREVREEGRTRLVQNISDGRLVAISTGMLIVLALALVCLFVTLWHLWGPTSGDRG